MNRIDRLIEAAGESALLEKLAEECGELTAAALKVNCVNRGESPMTLIHARANLVEEMADVLVMLRVVKRLLAEDEAQQLNKIAHSKEKRMYERLLSYENNEH